MLSSILSGFLALMIGVGAAFVIERSDRTLKSPDDVQRYLRIPSLATVLHVSGYRKSGLPPPELLPLNWSHVEGVPSSEGNGNDKGLHGKISDVAVSESYRAIRTSILHATSERPPQTILFTSASSGEGKSVTATNTAAAFANLVNPILLIDADLRRPSCHRLLDQDPQEGLSEVLRGHRELRDVIQSTRVPGLFLLSAGTIPLNPSELLSSKKMLEVVLSAQTKFEHVLIDSAPILPVSDSVVLSRLVDGVVLVAGCRTPKSVVRDACLRLHSVGASVLGVVLNEARRESQQYHQYYSGYTL
jgi:capsular exopolysaccharide synthesis family protein